MASDLLPPNATPLERAMSLAGARVEQIPLDLQALWDPATCPADLLPWLAWAVSIDHWRIEWVEAQKRQAIATAIQEQRVKGSRATVEAVLQRFDDLLQLVEWFEATPRLDPYLFEVHLPIVTADGETGGARISAATARAIIAEVALAKPARAHFRLVHTLELAAPADPVAAAQTMGFVRITAPAVDAGDLPWGDLIQNENGEPLQDDAGGFIDGSPA